MAEALSLVRQELGEDAVILTTREFPVRRWFPWKSRKRVEVVAAVDDSPPAPPAAPDRSVAGAGRERLAAVLERPSAPRAASVGHHYSDRREQPMERAGFEEWEPDWRVLIRKLAAEGASPAASLMTRLTARLMAGGMEEKWAQRLAENAVLQIPDEGPWDMEEALARLREVTGRLLADRIGAPIAPDARVLAFIGPTGVGKTTTIAKLAAIQSLDEERKVALVTADTYRIAAVEQLRTYANIIGIPCMVAYTPDEMRRVIEGLQDYDRILIDTAGRNFSQVDHVQHLMSMLKAASPDETYLVLSLAGKGSDMRRTVEALREVPIDKYVFTKVDETESAASAVDLILRAPKPVSYVTTGQSVPDDIAEANVHHFIDRL